MRKGAKALALGIVLTWLLVVAVTAQGTGRVAINTIDTSAHPTMSVLLSVQDANGVPIPDLEAGQFELVEDGHTSFPPERVATQVNPDVVTAIALVVDLSGSMKGTPLDEAKSASADLLDALLDKDSDPDRAAFFGINRSVSPTDLTLDESVEVAFGNDKNKILNVINFLSVEGNRATPLYDALYRVVRITSQQPGQRAIIVITDGIDKVSTFKADDVINEANRSQIPIFPISLSTNQLDETFLKRLAVRTGGEYRKAPGPEEFSALFQQVLDQMKLEYQLTYASRLASDGNPHSLLISVRAPRVQGFAEKKFQLGEAAVASDTPGATAAPSDTATPGAATPIAPTPTPVVEGGTVIDDLITFIQDNPVPAALIAVAALLLIALLVLLVVWLRRRNAPTEAQADYDVGASDGGWQAPQSGPMPGGMAVTGSAGFGGGGGGSGGGVPTVGPGGVATGAATVGPGAGAAPTSAPTVGPGAGPGYAPPAFGGAPQPPRPGAGAPAGSTMILDRTPKLKHAALLIERKDPSKRHDLRAETDIGRTQNNAVVIADATVSRQHARIRLQDDKFMLFDLGSANGTFVNGQKVEQPRALADGDVVRFGEVEVVFRQLT